MHPNEALINAFYEAFARHDGPSMATAYHQSARFSDPVFPDLDGPGAGAMWQMLTEGGGDLRIEASQIRADDESGSAHWEAWYSFPVTNRKVHNIIEASFKFKEGKIIEHVDSFDFWRWSRQALGMPGILLGWSPFLKKQVRIQAGRGLEKWRKKNL